MKITRRYLPALCVLPALAYLGVYSPKSSAQPRPVKTATGYTWSPVSIVAGGYVPGLIAHPNQPGLIYARTDIGSVYRWNPNAGRWIPLTDFHNPNQYNLNGPESIALDPTDPNRLYIAAGMYTSSSQSAFMVSTNQGATFSTYPAPFPMGANNDGRAAGERLAVNPFNPSQLFMGSRARGLWKSDDYAQTWSQVASFPVQFSTDGFGVQWVVFDPINSGTVYVGSYTNASIYTSTDDGQTWAALPGQPTAWPFTVNAGTKPPAPERAVINPDGNLYINYGDLPGPNAMNYGMVQRFNPATSTWTNITPPYDTANGQTGPRGGFSGMSQDPKRPGTVAVSTFDRWYPVDTVYMTHDGGGTWTDIGRTTANSGFAGPNAGNFYFNPSVFSQISPWLTFGNQSSPKGSSKFGWWISSLLIDPVNPDHLMFGTGATIYATDNVSAADSNQSPSWYVQGVGIEETAVLALISPTAGAHLLSGVGDIGGFRHDDLNSSPAAGMFTNPVATTVGSLDWAGQSPLVITRSQSPSGAKTSPCTWGASSADGGTTWAPFPTCANGAASSNGGTVTVDASGSVLAWSTAVLGGPQYSVDGGATWNTTTGLAGRVTAVADKVTPKLFYGLSNGNFYSTTTSGGTAFTKVNTSTLPGSGRCYGSGCGTAVASFAIAGDLWLPLGSNGLYHSPDGGVTWNRLANIASANSVAVGAAVRGSAIPSVYVYGSASDPATIAIYRSDDNGANWLRINDDAHQYGGPTVIQADSRVFGRVYLGMNGRGIVFGELPSRIVRRR